MKEKEYGNISYYIIIAVSVAIAHFIICAFGGIWPWDGNAFNSYTLQSLTWLAGRVDLPHDIRHLEIAYYMDKYYISFPPFPSVVMLPFAAFLGELTPDHYICLFFGILSGCFAFKLSLNFNTSKDEGLFWSIFLTTGTNFLFLISRGWVWFIAQTMSVSFTLMSFYFASNRDNQRPVLSLLCLCCAFGCRPFQIIYTPLSVYLIYKNGSLSNVKNFFIKLIIWSIPAALLGMVCMLYNYARFENVFDFGRQYLPEHMNSSYGDFSTHYLIGNLRRLFSLPYMIGKKLVFQKYNGTAFYLVIPIYISFFLYLIAGINRKITNKNVKCQNNDQAQNQAKEYITDTFCILLIWLLATAHTILLCFHSTMGGWQFGNRYMVDVLPAAYLCIAYLSPGFKRLLKYNYPLYILGAGINIAGTVFFHLDML